MVEVSLDCIKLFSTAKKIGHFTKGQDDIALLLLEMVRNGKITEAQACYTLGMVSVLGEKGSREFIEKTRKTLKEEVNKND